MKVLAKMDSDNLSMFKKGVGEMIYWSIIK